MNNKIFRKITLSLLLVALVMVAGILLTEAGDLARNTRDGQSDSQLATLEDNVLAALAVPAVEAAAVSFDLCASDGSITLPDSTVVSVWGFVNTGGGPCTTGLVSSPPGPQLGVTVGDDVTINLTNALTENVSILIPGQNVTASGDVAGTFTAEAFAGGGTATYTFTAQEGTYLYESGSNASIQVPMGLYGALIVDSGVSGQAYGHTYDQDAVLLLSEIDLNLNANPAGFDLLTYHPTYWLINGQAYDMTSSPIAAMSGEKVLLRYLNAGFDHPSMTLLGGYQEVIAKDGFPLPNSYDAMAEIVPAGTTADMIVDTTGLEGSLPLYNRNMYVTNGDAYPGGMLTFLDISMPVGSAPTVAITSPVQGSTVYGDAVTVQIDASDAEDAAGTLIVEWNVDGGAWQSASWVGPYYEATLDSTLLSDGSHALNARATDSAPNTATDRNSINVSNVPVVSIVAPAEGAEFAGDAFLVQIDASDAEDTAGSLIVMWDVDGGTPVAAAYNGVSGYYEAVLDTTVLAEGAHTINATAEDDRLNMGTDSNNATVSNQPSIVIIAPADNADVFGQETVQIDASDVEDDAGGVGSLTVTWGLNGDTSRSTTYNAGTGYYEANWDTTADGPGTYTLDAQITDSRGNMATDSNLNITVSPPNSIHIGDLDDASVQAGGPNWLARVTAEVHDLNEATVAGATVYMDVTRISKAGDTITDALSCLTEPNGRCTIELAVNANQLDEFENNVTFSVTDVTNLPADPYDSGLNHDDDPDPPDASDGTTLVVEAP